MFQREKYATNGQYGQRFIHFFETMIKVFLLLLILDVFFYFAGNFIFIHFMIHMAMIPTIFILIELWLFELCCNVSQIEDDEKD